MCAMSATTTWALAALLALLFAAAPVLLDGPSEFDAAVATASDLQDAIQTAQLSKDSHGN